MQEMQERQVQSLDREDNFKMKMETHFSRESWKATVCEVKKGWTCLSNQTTKVVTSQQNFKLQ